VFDANTLFGLVIRMAQRDLYATGLVEIQASRAGPTGTIRVRHFFSAR
jgi:hypothetical protein